MDSEKVFVFGITSMGVAAILIMGVALYYEAQCKPQSHVMGELSAPIHCDTGSLAEVQVGSRGVRVVTCVCPADR